MYAFLYLDVLHVHTAIVPLFGCIARICLASFIWMYCMFIQIVRRTNICMASFIWMYCIFIQQL